MENKIKVELSEEEVLFIIKALEEHEDTSLAIKALNGIDNLKAAAQLRQLLGQTKENEKEKN